MRNIMVTVWLFVCVASAADNSARSWVNSGWQDSFAEDRGWRPEPWLVHDADERSQSRFGPAGAVFEVSTVGRGMAWTRTTTPIWVQDFPLLEVDYSLAGADDGGEAFIVLSDDSTGPITPGALNPENPQASGGRIRVSLPAAERHLRLDLRSQLKTDRIARLTFLVQSRGGPMRLSVQRMVFSTSGPATGPSSALFTDDEAGVDHVPGDWQAIPLPDGGDVSAAQLAQALRADPAWPDGLRIRHSGITFQLRPAAKAAWATGVSERASLQLEGKWQGRRLAMLLASRLYGGDGPWMGEGSARPREVIRSPHELALHLEYDDGTHEIVMPQAAATGRQAIERLPRAYLAPLTADKTLVRIRVDERMSYGQVFLLAASIDVSQAGQKAPIAEPPPVAPPSAPQAVATVIHEAADQLTIENAWLRAVVDLAAGIAMRELNIVPLNRQVISADSASSASLEVVDGQGKPLAMKLKERRVRREAEANHIELAWAVDGSSKIEVRLTVEVSDRGELRFTPTLDNGGDAPWQGGIRYPRLGPCRIAEAPEHRGYLLGAKTTILDHQPIEVEKPYGGGFPLQVMDLYDLRGTGGLGLLVEDSGLLRKNFCFRQDNEGAVWSVFFPSVQVAAHAHLTLAPVVLFAHVGDWHTAFERCRSGARAGVSDWAGKRMRNLFYCRRDYPLGGTDYLFDAAHKRYTPLGLIEESIRELGGIDMIDISGWAYHEATGRVGDYLTNDLGGLEELRRGVQVAHQQKVTVGLYFEGYLIDRRAPLASKALPAWQLIHQNGKGGWWPGEMEFFACPGVEEWRRELSSAIADAAAATGADAVYVDEFGFCDEGKMCWSSDHSHPVPSNPMIEESRMLAAVRRALDARTPGVGIYVEQMPCDAMVSLIDGAFNYGMVWGGPGQHVTKLPLHRYVFPEVASIEMVGYGIRPVPLTEDDLHLCVFHGLAAWLKGRGESWYDAGFRDTARRAYAILRDHAETFRSPDCTPLVPTLMNNIYANRFVGRDEVVLTVYNAAYGIERGDLLATSLPREWQVRDACSAAPVDYRREGERIILSGSIEPRSVRVYVFAPQAKNSP